MQRESCRWSFRARCGRRACITVRHKWSSCWHSPVWTRRGRKASVCVAPHAAATSIIQLLLADGRANPGRLGNTRFGRPRVTGTPTSSPRCSPTRAWIRVGVGVDAVRAGVVAARLSAVGSGGVWELPQSWCGAPWVELCGVGEAVGRVGFGVAALAVVGWAGGVRMGWGGWGWGGGEGAAGVLAPKMVRLRCNLRLRGPHGSEWQRTRCGLHRQRNGRVYLGRPTLGRSPFAKPTRTPFTNNAPDRFGAAKHCRALQGLRQRHELAGPPERHTLITNNICTKTHLSLSLHCHTNWSCGAVVCARHLRIYANSDRKNKINDTNIRLSNAQTRKRRRRRSPPRTIPVQRLRQTIVVLWAGVSAARRDPHGLVRR